MPEEGSVEREVPTEASTGVADTQGMHPLAPEFPLRLLHLQNRGSSVSSCILSGRWHCVGREAAESSEQQAPDCYGHRNDLAWAELGNHGSEFFRKRRFSLDIDIFTM